MRTVIFAVSCSVYFSSCPISNFFSVSEWKIYVRKIPNYKKSWERKYCQFFSMMKGIELQNRISMTSQKNQNQIFEFDSQKHQQSADEIAQNPMFPGVYLRPFYYFCWSEGPLIYWVNMAHFENVNSLWGNSNLLKWTKVFAFQVFQNIPKSVNYSNSKKRSFELSPLSRYKCKLCSIPKW